MPFAPSSYLLLVVRPGAPSSDAPLLLVAICLVVRPGAPSSDALCSVAMPFAPSSYLLLVVRPGAPSSDSLCSVRSVLCCQDPTFAKDIGHFIVGVWSSVGSTLFRAQDLSLFNEDFRRRAGS